MSGRQKPCPDCGAAIVYAATPNGGRARLAPYPDPQGRYRVATGRHGLMILREDEHAEKVKRYDRHVCVGARKAVPRTGRPQQLPLLEPGGG